MGLDHILTRCMMQEAVRSVLEEAHEGLAGGRMGLDATTKNVLEGLW